MRSPAYYQLFTVAIVFATSSHAYSQSMQELFDLPNDGDIVYEQDAAYSLAGYCDGCGDVSCGCEPDCGCEPGCGCEPDCGCEPGCGCEPSCGCGTAKKKAKPNPCVGSHKGVFYANNFSYLNDPCNKTECLGDCMKLMPVDSCGRWGTLDIGGQIRLRYHDEEGMGRVAGFSGFEDTENTFLLTRLRLYADWKMSENFRFYVEGISADVTGSDTYIPRPIDRNSGDLLNAFVDVGLTDNFKVRVGRQELVYGAQRLVSPLDWANTRRTFEGIKGMYKKGDWAIDGFYTNFVPVAPDAFDEADYDRSFYGVYGVYSGLENSTMDLYYLGFDDERNLAAISSDFSLHTVGGRLSGKLDGKWLYEVEGAYQGGRQSGLALDHNAGFVTAGVGRKLNCKWDTTLWMYFDYASGNDSVGEFERFNQLFPLAHKYLGFIDAVARSNVLSPNVLLKTKPHKKVDLLLWYYYFGAAEAEDIIPGVAVPSNQVAGEDDFGQELDFICKYTFNPRSNIVFGYSHLWPGNKIVSTNDASFFYSQWTLNF